MEHQWSQYSTIPLFHYSNCERSELSSLISHYFFNFLLPKPARPFKPKPKSIIVAGSGTGAGSNSTMNRDNHTASVGTSFQERFDPFPYHADIKQSDI